MNPLSDIATSTNCRFASPDETCFAAGSRPRRRFRCWRPPAPGRRQRPPIRFVVFATPNGTRNSLFWPTGTETNFNFNTFTRRSRAVQEQADLPQGDQAEPVAAERRARRHARLRARARHGRHVDRAAAEVGDAVQELRQHDVGLGQRSVARSVPGDQAGAADDVPQHAARRARARHRGPGAHLLLGGRSADPAARGSEGRVRGAVRHVDRHARDAGPGADAAVGAAQERLRSDVQPRPSASRTWSAPRTRSGWTPT